MAENKKDKGSHVVNSQTGIIGNNAKVSGGIHFHNYHSPGGTGNEPSKKSDELSEGPAFDPATAANILHLSDLHFSGDKESDPVANAKNWYGQLVDDLCNELGCKRLHAVIISGDIGNFSESEEYQAAEVFLKKLCRKFSLDSSQLVIVPGNHDLNWKISKKGYLLLDKDDHDGPLKDGYFIKVSDDVIRLRDDNAYPKRFQHFSQFHETITDKPFNLDPNKQATIHHLPELNLLIVGFNSCWDADHHFKNRISINPNAVGFALSQIRDQEAYKNCLKLAVWHHPLVSQGDDRIRDHAFMQRLAQAEFRICLHGHIHKSDAGLFRYDMAPDGRKMDVIGAGTFGAPVKEWVPGYPLQYNLFRLSQNILRVETRCRREINGTWGSDHLWRQGKGKPNLPYYDILLSGSTNRRPTPEPEPPKPDFDLEAQIQLYCEKAKSLYEKLPLMGFKTKLRVPILIKDIYLPLGVMIDRRVTGEACFADADDAEKCLRKYGCEEISVPEAFKAAEKVGRRGIVILGDPGSGKTTHLKRVFLWCLEGGFKKLGLPSDMIPVFLPLRELLNLKANLGDFIQEQLSHPHLDTPEGFGKALLKRGNLLFLLDGLDEVSDTQERVRVSRWIDTALSVHKTCRFVVTCRFAGYTYTPQARLSEDFLEISMRSLTPDQAEEFIRNCRTNF
jgi:hypothetical protein